MEYKGTINGDSLYASPLAGCGYLPVAAFTVSDSTISVGQTVVYTDASTGDVTTWNWEFERGVPETFSGKTPPPVQYNAMGTYDVTLTVTNATGQSKKYKPGFIEVGPAGISNRSKPDFFRISPNPVKDNNAVISFNDNSEYRISVISSSGIPVLINVISSPQFLLECSGWAKGVYCIQITDTRSGRTDSKKLVVQ